MSYKSVKMVIGSPWMAVMRNVNGNVAMVFDRVINNVMMAILFQMTFAICFAGLIAEIVSGKVNNNVMMVIVLVEMAVVNYAPIKYAAMEYWISDRLVMMVILLQAMDALVIVEYNWDSHVLLLDHLVLRLLHVGMGSRIPVNNVMMETQLILTLVQMLV